MNCIALKLHLKFDLIDLRRAERVWLGLKKKLDLCAKHIHILAPKSVAPAIIESEF